MVEKRIVTRRSDGEIISIVEHHDLGARRRFYIAVGFLVAAVVFCFGWYMHWVVSTGRL